MALSGSNPRRAVWFLEVILWTVAVAALGYCAFVWTRARYDQAEGNWALEHSLPGDPSSGPSARRLSHTEGSLVGRIDIPRLDLSVVVFEGTSDGTLARGVGHLRGSARPGQRGNSVLAGHRDTFFRELRNIRRGDEIDIKGPEGDFEYAVASTAIVEPDRIDVLKPGDGSILTLITCFPFYYVGNAPRRFIVRATKVEKARHAS